MGSHNQEEQKEERVVRVRVRVRCLPCSVCVGGGSSGGGVHSPSTYPRAPRGAALQVRHQQNEGEVSLPSEYIDVVVFYPFQNQ